MSRADIDAFMAYIQQRNVPDKYMPTYKREITAILMEEGGGTLTALDATALGQAVSRVEQALRNRRAVVAALDAFLRDLRTGWTPSTPPPKDDDAMPDSIRTMNSTAVPKGDPSEHRRYVRVPFNGSVEVSGAVRGNNRASDISLGGLYLEARQSWERGELLTLTFRLHPDSPMLVVDGRVVFVDFGMGAGVDFVDPPREVRHAIRDYVEEMVAKER
jgi:PilZ domain